MNASEPETFGRDVRATDAVGTADTADTADSAGEVGEVERDSVQAYLGALLNGTALDGPTSEGPVVEEIVPAPPPPYLQFPDQDSFVSSCANSSSPICYNTSISGANIVTNLWFSAVLGLLCYLGFVAFRTKFRLYQARMHMPTVSHKPPPLILSSWHHRWWSWIIPVFRVSDKELLKSSGMDALIAVKILYFGILCFLPITIAAMAILIPVNYTDDYYSKTAQESGLSDEYSTVFIRLTMSNITPGSSVLWVHFFFVYGAVFWTCWLITEFYKEYISLRQAYVIRNTEAVGAHIGGSAEAFEQDSQPLITSRRSAMHSSFRDAVHSQLGKGQGETSGKSDSPSKSSLTMNELRRSSLDFINEIRDASRLKTTSTPLRILHEGSPRRDSIGALTNRSVSLSGRSVYETPYNARNPSGSSPSKSPAYSPSERSVGARTDDLDVCDNGRDGNDHADVDTETDGESVVDRNVTFSERWTEHDFSQDVMPLPLPPSTRKDHATQGALGSQNGRRSPYKHVRNGSASAAVAIALDMGQETTAATALAKIRHHRAASGASYASSLSNTTVTPLASPRGSPRRERGNQGSAFNMDEVSSMLRIPEGTQAELDSNTTTSPDRKSPSTVKDKKPHGLVQIITTVAQDNDENRTRAQTELPTAVALDPLMCDPEGQQGIGHHWWSYMKDAGSGRLKSEQIKGFVQPDMKIQSDAVDPDDPKEPITVNASLYTVLVTDEPIEKLRLNKPFKRTTDLLRVKFPRKMTSNTGKQNDGLQEDEDLASGKLSSKDVDALASVPSDDPAHIVVDATSPGSRDLERGAISNVSTRKESFHFPTDLSADKKSGSRELLTAAAKERDAKGMPGKSITVSERGMGLTSGWSATVTNLKQLWKRKGDYKEWRRDVRWAMFRKRARIATQMFTELFGEDFDSLIPIYPTQSVDKLIALWDKKCAKLERAQYDLKALLDKEAARMSQLDDRHSDWNQSQLIVDKKLLKYRKRLLVLKDQIVKLKEETTDLQDKIVQERELVLSDLPSTCFFATFKSQEAAAIASQANLNPIKERLLNVQAAPSPDDVNWPSLTRSWWQRQSRPIIVLPLILFIMLLPIGAFSGAFAQLTIAVCGSPADPTKDEETSWYCSADPWANFFRNLVTSLAPTLLLSLYHMCILPVLVYYAAQAEGQQLSLSGLDRRCCSLFFYWDVFNVFLGAMLGGSVIAELPTYIEDPTQIWNALSAAIPSSSNFFINYVAYRALVMAWFRLWYPHMGTTVSMLKWMRILPWAKSPREKALESPIRNCRYGRDIGVPVLMNFVMVLAYCVVSPLILPFGLLYFVFLWSVWRYQMLYVYQRSYESGGLFWPLVAHRIVVCLFICVFFTSVVFVLKEAYTQAALMLVSLPLYLLRYDIYISKRYDQVVEQIPLTAVHQAGRVESVDPCIWQPPPLREGAEGWHPQWGVVWQYWGVPRYSL